MRLESAVGLVAVVLCSGCAQGPDHRSAGDGVAVISASSAHSTEWDTMTAAVTVKKGCVAFGDTVAVFPQDSRLVGSPPGSVITPAGFEIRLDGDLQELLGDRHAVVGLDAATLLEGTDLELLRTCATRLNADDFWLVLNMDAPA